MSATQAQSAGPIRNVTTQSMKPIIRPVSQVTFELGPDESNGYTTAIRQVLEWMKHRAGGTLPTAAWELKSFELSDIGTQRAAAVAIQDPNYWAARLDDACKTVPLRTWVTEIGVGKNNEGKLLFGARLTCVSRGTDEPFERSIPSFIRRITQRMHAQLDGIAIVAEPRIIKNENGVDELVELLESNQRHVNVVVFSLPVGSESAKDALGFPSDVQLKTLGAAHVFLLSAECSSLLSERVGKDLSVFRRSVRTYRPGFRAWLDEPSDHPFASPEAIQNWNDGEGEKGFSSWLISYLLSASVRGMEREERLPTFNFVRQHAAIVEQQNFKEAGGSDAGLIYLYEKDNEQLRRELTEQRDTHTALLKIADQERDEALKDANVAKAQARQRSQRIRDLEAKLDDLALTPVTLIPNNLESFRDWCDCNLVGSVEMTTKAFQGVRKSELKDPNIIYQALLLLRDFYVPMRINSTDEKRNNYLTRLRELGLEESATGDAINYSSDLYSVLYGGRRRALDRHLKGSDARNRQFGFRAYFFWDEEGQVVVVGWLPSHLDNRAS